MLSSKQMASITSANRGTSWSDCEVKALIAMWGESNVRKELDGAVRSKVFMGITI